MRHLLIIAVMLTLAAPGIAAERPGDSLSKRLKALRLQGSPQLEPPADATRVELKPVEDLETALAGGTPGGVRRLVFDDQGKAEVPFATPSGTLRFSKTGSRIQVDTNDDGKFTDADASPAPARGLQIGITTVFGDGKAPYRIQGHFLHENIWFFSGSGAVAGELAGKRLIFADANSNGAFLDLGADAVRGQDISCTLTPLMLRGRKAMHVAPIAGGTALMVWPYKGDMGSARLEIKGLSGNVQAVLKEMDSGLEVSFDKAGQERPLPAGRYRIHRAWLQVEKPRKPSLFSALLGRGGGTTYASLSGSGGEVEVAADEPKVIEVGPSRIAAEARRQDRSVEILDVVLTDSNGVSWCCMSGVELELQQDGKVLASSCLEYG